MLNGNNNKFKNFKEKCHKCKSPRNYQNPMDICFECSNRFCFDCLNALQVNSQMKADEPVRSVCDNCVKIHKYYRLGDEPAKHSRFFDLKL